MTATFNPYAYAQPAKVATDTLDAINRILQLHWTIPPQAGDAELLADLALKDADFYNMHPVDAAIRAIVVLDKAMERIEQPKKVVPAKATEKGCSTSH